MFDVLKIHDEVFNLLSNWSKESQSMNVLNPYFHMRSKKDARFKKGYWFPGDETYLCISFWSGHDKINRTPNIFFAITEKNGCFVKIVSKDSKDKLDFFKKLINDLNFNSTTQYKSESETSWRKNYSNTYLDYIKFLKEFIVTDKRLIDNFIFDNLSQNLINNISDFGFISKDNFEKYHAKILNERNILSKNKFVITKNEKDLPFGLIKVDIENYQEIRRTSINNLPLDANWIFVTGENSYGKTCLLRAIALGFSNNPDLEKYFESEKTVINIEYSYKNNIDYIVRSKRTWDNNNYDINRLFINNRIEIDKYIKGYGPIRLNVHSVSSENKEYKFVNNIESLFDDTTLLKNINYELFAAHFVDEEFYIHLKELIKTATNNKICNIIIEKKNVRFVEMLEDGSKSEPLPLEKIAAGYRSIINLIFDIYIRYKESNLFSSPKECFGIVLIDELENHLHPIMQKLLPGLLSEIFPKIQFIASTHSPIPLLGAPKNSVILKVDRTKEKGITVERVDDKINYWNLLPNSILTSPIFDFEDIYPENKKDDNSIRTEDTYKEIELNDEIKLKLKDIARKLREK